MRKSHEPQRLLQHHHRPDRLMIELGHGLRPQGSTISSHALVMPGNLGSDGLLDRPVYGLKIFRVLAWFDGPLEG